MSKKILFHMKKVVSIILVMLLTLSTLSVNASTVEGRSGVNQTELLVEEETSFPSRGELESETLEEISANTYITESISPNDEELLDVQQTPRASLVLSRDSWNPGASMEEMQVNVTASARWSISIDVSWMWVQASGMYSNYTGAFILATYENTTPTARVGTVTVTADGISRTVRVTQAGFVNDVTPVTLTLDQAASVRVNHGIRREVRFTAPTAGVYAFRSTDRGDLDPTAYTTLTGTEVLDDNSGADNTNYSFAKELSAGETFTFYSGYYNNFGNGTYSVTVTQNEMPTLTLSKTSWAPEAFTAYTHVDVTASSTWSVEANVSWLIVRNTNINSNYAGNFMLEVEANTATTQRVGSVTVTCGGISRTVTVTQAGVVNDMPFTLSKTSWNLEAATAQTYVDVTAGSTWSVETNASWLIVKMTSIDDNYAGNFMLEAEENTATTQRVGIATVTCGGISRTVTVTQAGVVNDDTTPIALTLDQAKSVKITNGIRREVRFTAPIEGMYMFESANRAGLNPTAYVGPIGEYDIDDDSGADNINYLFYRFLREGQTYTFYSGYYDNSSQGTYDVIVTKTATPALILNQDSWNLEASAGQQVHVGITASGYWEVDMNIPWLKMTMSNISNSYVGGFTLEAEENTATTQRVGIITITVDGLSKTVTVTQAGAVNNSAPINLTLDQAASVNITNGVRREVHFKAPATGAYMFESTNRAGLDPKAYTMPTGSEAIDDDSGTDSRNYLFYSYLSEGETYKFYSGYYNDSSTGTYEVTVTQNMKPMLSLSKSSWNLGTSATWTDVGIKASDTWNVNINVPWLKMTASSIISSKLTGAITLEAEENTATTQRVGIVSVTAGGISKTVTVTQAGVVNESTSITLTLNQSANVSITNGERREVRFTAPETGIYTFESIERAGLDPKAYVTLTGAEALDDDSGTDSRNYSFTKELIAGETYTFYSGYYNNSNTGMYKVIVTKNNTPILNLSKYSWNLEASTAQTEIGVIATDSWFVRTNVPWLRVRMTSIGGSAGDYFILEATENTASVARVGMVEVIAGGMPRTVTVTQAGVTSL